MTRVAYRNKHKFIPSLSCRYSHLPIFGSCDEWLLSFAEKNLHHNGTTPMGRKSSFPAQRAFIVSEKRRCSTWLRRRGEGKNGRFFIHHMFAAYAHNIRLRRILIPAFLLSKGKTFTSMGGNCKQRKLVKGEEKTMRTGNLTPKFHSANTQQRKRKLFTSLRALSENLINYCVAFWQKLIAKCEFVIF